MSSRSCTKKHEVLCFPKESISSLHYPKTCPWGQRLERDIGEDLLLIIRPLWRGAGIRLAPIEKIIHLQGKSPEESGVSDTPAD